MTIKAAAYKRTDPDAPAGGGAASEQMTRTIVYAEERGLELLEIFYDATPGAGLHRPGLKSLLTAVNAGEFNVLIVDGLDRLSRVPAEVEAIAERLLDCGVQIHIIDEGVIAIPDALPRRKLN